MQMMVENQITNGPKLADVSLDGTVIHVKLIDEPIEFSCVPISEDLTNEFLNWILFGPHPTWVKGLANYKIIEANVPFKQSHVVECYDFVQEMKEGKSELAKAILNVGKV